MAATIAGIERIYTSPLFSSTFLVTVPRTPAVGQFQYRRVPNVAFGGEASPILIFALLFIAAALIGFAWRYRAWPAAALLWACIPAVHLIKHGFSLPDTMQPNTYASILKLAAVTPVVTLVAMAGGTAVDGLKKLISRNLREDTPK